jgi:MFS transporter, UMF1 family
VPSSTEMSRDSMLEGRRLHAWLDKIGLGRPELRAWAMYDWANSAMACTIVTAVFPVYYGSVACAGMTRERATQWFSLWTTVAMVMIALISPLLGTIADFNGQKKRMLGGFLVLGVASVAAMFFIYQGDWLLASVLFILANIGANGSYVFYDALLPHIARDDEVDRVSTAGYALGYIGGGTLLALNLAWILKPEWFGLPAVKDLSPQGTLPSRLAFLSVAVWWLIFSIPLFRRVPEPAAAGGGRESGLPVGAAIHRLVETGRSLRSYRHAFVMLVAFLIYNDGIGTIMRMATRYGDEIGIGQEIMIGAIVLVQFVGIPFAFLFGMLAGRIGAKRSIALGLLGYTAICIFGYFMQTGIHFLVLAVLVGVVQGGTQALSRSLFASLIPRDKSGEFFGFFGVAEKFAGIFGPAIFGLVNLMSGSSRNSILSVIAFFIAGGILLAQVDVAEGQRLARAEEAEAFADQRSL